MIKIRRNHKKWLLFILQITITFLFLYLTFHDTHLNALTISFTKINYWMLSLTLVPQFISLFLLAAREKYLLHKIYPFKFNDLLKGVIIGFIGNNVLPLRGGEFLKVLYWSKQSKESYITLLSVAFLERLLDLLVLMVIFFIASQAILFQLGIKIKFVLIFLAVILFSIAALFFLDWKYQKKLKMHASLQFIFSESVVKKIDNCISKIMHGFRVLGDIKNIFYALSFTIAYWIMNLLGLYIILYAFHLTITWQEIIVILLATSFGVAIPAAPGNIGTYDYFAKMPLVYYGVSASVATTFAIVSHIISIVPFTLLGIVFVYPTLSRLMKSSKVQETC